MNRESGYPCTLSFRVQRAFITGDPDGARPDPSIVAIRDPEGNIYTGSIPGGQVIEWSAEGKRMRDIGRPGEGPGEMTTGAQMPYWVTGDSLYVRDNTLRWMVFGPDHNFVRSSPMGRISGLYPFTFFLEDGNVLSTSPRRRSGAEHPFAIVSREGEVQSEFGEFPPQEGAAERGWIGSYVRGRMFWVASILARGGGYQLEQWNTDGVRSRRLERTATWIGRRENDPESHRAPPYPTVSYLHEDSLGFLYVVVTTVPGGWQEGFDQLPPGDLSKHLGHRAEVIDPRLPEVLASHEFTFDDNELATEYFQGSRTGYRFVEDTLGGIQTMSLVSFDLRGATRQSCAI
jgi:hypothetical protein